MAATAFKNPKWRKGTQVPFTAHGTITAGDPVSVYATAEVVQTAPNAAKSIIGVAMETVADGDLVTVDIRGSIWNIKAKGAITAGDPIGAASDGSSAWSTITVAAYTDLQKVAGTALDTISDGGTGLAVIF